MHEALVRSLRRNRHERRPAVTRCQLVQQVGLGAETLPDAVGRQAQEIADRFDAEGEQALADIRIEIDAASGTRCTAPRSSAASSHTVVPW
jgi:hypothetical protein